MISLARPRVFSEIALFSADGFRRISGVGASHQCGDEPPHEWPSRETLLDAARAKAPEFAPLHEGDYVAIRTGVDYGDTHYWEGRDARYSFGDWLRI